MACRVTFTVALDGDGTAEVGAATLGAAVVDAAAGATVAGGFAGESLPLATAIATPPPLIATIAAAVPMSLTFIATPPKGSPTIQDIRPKLKTLFAPRRGPSLVSALIDVAAVVTAIGIPTTGWIFNRIAKARQGETNAVVNGAVTASEERIKSHVDTRIDELSRVVHEIDGREQDTRQQLAHLKGRFDERAAIQQGG